LSISEPALRLFAHYLCLLCFNPGTVWNVDEDGTLYFVRAGEAELLIPLAREDPRFKVEGPYIRWEIPRLLCARFLLDGVYLEPLAQFGLVQGQVRKPTEAPLATSWDLLSMPGRVFRRRAHRLARFYVSALNSARACTGHRAELSPSSFSLLYRRLPL
jgi:hypothetical protein